MIESGLSEVSVPEAMPGEETDGELVLPEPTRGGSSSAMRPAPLLTSQLAFEPAAARPGLAARRYVADPSLDDSESLRKDAAITSIFTSLSMLIGAFIASVSGALGGRLRDEHP